MAAKDEKKEETAAPEAPVDLVKHAEKGPLPGSGSTIKGEGEVVKPTKEAEATERERNKALAEGGQDHRF